MRELLARRQFREMAELEALVAENSDLIRSEVVDEVSFKGRTYPLYVLSLGSQNMEDPALGLFGGVHGLEKIGSEVLLSYLNTTLHLLRWDVSFQERMKKSRLVFMPIINPVGMLHLYRSNGNGVDLMRNSPIDGESTGRSLYRGHRIGPQIPWYRGPAGAEMEVEAKALCRVVEDKLFPARVSLAMDVHSGFGAKDRIWFPYSYTHSPFPFLSEAYTLKEIFDQTYPHHFYDIEPVSCQYTIHGDLWDYLYLKKHPQGCDLSKGFFMPWTLEMGSWMWLRKNPIQVFTKIGIFHPMKPHRRHRILRRHLNLFDFFHRGVLSADRWLFLDAEDKERQRAKAMDLWYE